MTEARLNRILILHASASTRQGGSATFLRNLCESLRQNGVAMTVVFLERGGLAKEFEGRGFEVVALSAGRTRQVFRTIGTVLTLHRLIRARGVALVLSNGAHEHFYGGAAAWLARIPSIWYCHACAESGDRTVQFASMVPAKAVLTHSEYTQSRLKRSANISARIVYPGVDIPQTDAIGAALRAEFGIAPGVPVISMVAVFMACKGQHVFIRAAARIREQVPTCMFLLAGDAPFERHRGYADDLRRLARELGVDEAVRFLGFRNDADAVLSASDIIVHPSTQPEPFGIVLLEALSRAKPVVSIATGGAREIVGSGDTALLVPPSDPDAIAEACLTLLKDPALGRQLGRAGRCLVERRFSLDSMGRELLRHFAEAAPMAERTT